MEWLIDRYGEGTLMLMTGLTVGLVFGACAYRARFCLRAATAEVADGRLGPKLMIWLMAFLSALIAVQGAIAAGWLEVSAARQLAATGSLSGAIIGGLMFGAGMILARGCASRLLVLSASGNLRAIVTGLVLTLTAQAALRGVLSPTREALAGLWTIQGGPARSMADPTLPVMALCILALAIVLFRARREAIGWPVMAASVGVGLAVYLGWQATYLIAAHSFDIIAVQSVTFTGPSTDTLMALVNARSLPADFGVGLVPGVFLGAFVTALAMREARIQRFEADVPMERYLIGGVLMGFGSMLAGGCAVGAGMSGGAIFALTAWVAVFCMWLGAMATHRVLQAATAAQAA